MSPERNGILFLGLAVLQLNKRKYVKSFKLTVVEMKEDSEVNRLENWHDLQMHSLGQVCYCLPLVLEQFSSIITHKHNTP